MCHNLLNYIADHPDDWYINLQDFPYNLSIEQYDNYYFFNYTAESDMDNLIVHDANCTILRFNTDINKWICVCFPFPKVYKYGEHRFTINWTTSRVYSKIDGKMICIWCDKGKWHISARNQFDFSSDEALIEATCGANLTTLLQPEYCYVFILTAPQYKYIIDYGEHAQLWYVSRRHMILDKENECFPNIPDWINTIHFFPYLKRAAYILALRKTFESNECGMIIVNDDGNRIAVESFKYAHKDTILRPPLTMLRVIELWQSDTLDEYLDIIEHNVEIIDDFLTKLEDIKHEIENVANLKSFARMSKRLKILMPVSVEWYNYENKDAGLEYFLKNVVKPKTILQELNFINKHG